MNSKWIDTYLMLHLYPCRKLLERKVGEIGDTEHQLEFRLSQLSAAENRVSDLETELDRVTKELAVARADGAALRGNVSRLDHDKDLLTVSMWFRCCCSSCFYEDEGKEFVSDCVLS